MCVRQYMNICSVTAVSLGYIMAVKKNLHLILQLIVISVSCTNTEKSYNLHIESPVCVDAASVSDGGHDSADLNC